MLWEWQSSALGSGPATGRHRHRRVRHGTRLWGGLGLAVSFALLFSGPHAHPQITAAPPGGLLVQLRLALAVRDFRRLLTTFVVQALAIGAMLAGVDYVARHVLQSPSAGSVLFACFVGPALLVTPGWRWLAGRVGKKRGYLISSLVLAVGAAGLVGAGRLPTLDTYLLTALTGIGYAGCQLFPLAMLPDTAGEDARRTGENRVGVFTGVWTAGETLGLALGPAGYALVLSLGGDVSSTAGGVGQPASAVTAIVLGFSVLPAGLILLSLLSLRGYALIEEDVNDGR
jgi:GPH family glycoside/pentoside/hexuronide:cation symporter